MIEAEKHSPKNLNRLCLGIIHRDKNDKILHEEFGEAHSLLRAFNRATYAYFNGPSVSIVNTSNVSQNWDTGDTMRSDAAAGTTTYGVVVGTGTTAVAIDDYAVETIIAHGTGTGQLDYGVSTNTTYESASEDYVLCQRVVTNLNAASLSVTESGLYVHNGSYFFCIARDVFASAYTLANGDTLTVQYFIKVVL